MKKITFKVSSPKDYSVQSLIKEVNKISCRIYIDLENGFIAVEEVNDTTIDSVIELINNYYAILSIEIDNTFDRDIGKQIESVIAENSADTIKDIGVSKQPKVLDPQTEDDLIIKKVEFDNECVENRINHFL